MAAGVVPLLVAAWAASGAEVEPSPPPPPSLLLVTLDTTRADALGCYGAGDDATPHLDALAARGVRYERAFSPSPLTLPAHASLLTGRLPPEHGVLDNGTHRLETALPTLASVLAARGYATGAVVASRVLDRRFGLATGFAHYDDTMAAEQVGQYGYPERDAAAVTTAAVEWLRSVDDAAPWFLWVHYYDPHAPYAPPGGGGYAGEVAFVDRQLGRLLAGLPAQPATPLVAVVGDHGEALGEHGEEGHGIFLYRTTLQVPLLLAGPGVPAGTAVTETVGAERLAATLLRLLGADDLPGPHLPGLPALGDDPPPRPVYSETWMPASAYGWAPLQALTDGAWRLIVAPRPELYDLAADPAEEQNLLAGERTAAARRRARALRDALRDLETRLERREAPPAAADAELAAELRSLGYLQAGRGAGGGAHRDARFGEGVDPKDGVALLDDFERAKHLQAAGRTAEALAAFESLVERNPDNVPFLTHLGTVRLAAGRRQAALAALQRAIELNPRLHFLHLKLAEAHLHLGQVEEARAAYRRTLELDPRSAPAWLALAELAERQGDAAGERRLLRQAVEAGTASAAVHARLGQIARGAEDWPAAAGHLRRATELAPRWELAWLLLGELHATRGETAAAREALETAARLGAGTPYGERARRLLDALPDGG